MSQKSTLHSCTSGWLEEKNRQINETQSVNKWRVVYYFLYNFLKFTTQSFIVIEWNVPLMYHVFNYKLQKSILIVYTLCI